MRILFVQHAGDYREAYCRMISSSDETYYGHRYVLEQLESFGREFGEVAILCCLSHERYHETLSSGLSLIGAKAHPRHDFQLVNSIIEQWDPSHLVVLGPMTKVLKWGIANKRRIFCQCADSFNMDPLTRFVRYGRIISTLNHPTVEWVGNHGSNACQSFATAGVSASKLLSWDWPYNRTPEQSSPRRLEEGRPSELLYVGTLQPLKGVGDAIRAVAELKRRNKAVSLKIVGGGNAAKFEALSRKLGVADQIEFAGVLPNAQVFEMMRQATAIVVPSRRAYPEGLPLTIYEALCARTPIIASDHPMFKGHLIDRQTAMVFKSADSSQLADKIVELLADPELYHLISQNSAACWQRLQNPTKWGDVLHAWLADTDEDKTWLRDATLSAQQA